MYGISCTCGIGVETAATIGGNKGGMIITVGTINYKVLEDVTLGGVEVGRVPFTSFKVLRLSFSNSPELTSLDESSRITKTAYSEEAFELKS